MAFINPQGMKISYECSDLIEELRMDMLEFGYNEKVVVWCKDKQGVTLYTNYDFPEGEHADLLDGEYIKYMTIGELLPLLEQQNEIL